MVAQAQEEQAGLVQHLQLPALSMLEVEAGADTMERSNLEALEVEAIAVLTLLFLTTEPMVLEAAEGVALTTLLIGGVVMAEMVLSLLNMRIPSLFPTLAAVLLLQLQLLVGLALQL